MPVERGKTPAHLPCGSAGGAPFGQTQTGSRVRPFTSALAIVRPASGRGGRNEQSSKLGIVLAGSRPGLREGSGNGPPPDSCRSAHLPVSGAIAPITHRRLTLGRGQSRLRSAPATCSRRPSPRVTLAPAPFVGDRAHRLGRAVLDPLHEGPVELEAGVPLGVQEAANVLLAAVTRG
jgi:hypothetical protein